VVPDELAAEKVANAEKEATRRIELEAAGIELEELVLEAESVFVLVEAQNAAMKEVALHAEIQAQRWAPPEPPEHGEPGGGPCIEVALAGDVWFTVAEDPGAVMRASPALASEQVGRVALGSECRCDKIVFLPEGRRRSHVAEKKSRTSGQWGNLVPTLARPQAGWVSTKWLRCKAGGCGFCGACDPSQEAKPPAAGTSGAGPVPSPEKALAMAEWTGYLRKIHSEKQVESWGSGGKWLRELLYKLRHGSQALKAMQVSQDSQPTSLPAASGGRDVPDPLIVEQIEALKKRLEEMESANAADISTRERERSPSPPPAPPAVGGSDEVAELHALLAASEVKLAAVEAEAEKTELDAAQVEARLRQVEEQLHRAKTPPPQRPTEPELDLNSRPPWNEAVHDPYRHLAEGDVRSGMVGMPPGSAGCGDGIGQQLLDRIKQLELAQWETRLKELEAKTENRSTGSASPRPSPRWRRQPSHRGLPRSLGILQAVQPDPTQPPSYEEIRSAAYIGLFGEDCLDSGYSAWDSPRSAAAGGRSGTPGGGPVAVDCLHERGGRRQLNSFYALLSDGESTLLQRMYSDVTFDILNAYLIATVNGEAHPLEGRTLAEVGFRPGGRDLLSMRFRGGTSRRPTAASQGPLRGLTTGMLQ